MTRRTSSPGVPLPELHAALIAYLAEARKPAPGQDPLVQDPLFEAEAE